jgi:peroxiredoxin
MRRKIAIATILSLALLVGAVSALEIGDEMPAADAQLKNIDGKTHVLGDLKGEKGTLIVFTCVHCPVVQAAQERMVNLGNKYSEKGIGVAFINANDPKVYAGDGLEGMQAQAEKQGYKFPYLVDDGSKVARAFGAQRTPEMFLFDSAGKLAYHGTIDDSPMKAEQVKKHYLRDALAAVVAGEEVAHKQSRAVGCSIKFYK